MNVPLKRRSMGENLSLTFSLGFAHLGKLAVIALLFQAPLLVYQYMLATGVIQVDPRDSASTFLVATGVVFLLSMVVGPAQSAASILVVSGSFTGKPIGVGRSLTAAIGKIVPVLLASIIVGIIVGVGLLLLIIPGIIFLIWYFMTTVVVVLEDSSPTAALARSKTLSEGVRMDIFLLLVIVGILTSVVTGVVEAGLTSAVQSVPLHVFVSWAVQTVLSVFYVVIPVLYYFQQRTVKEGYDVARIADLVDRVGQRRDARSES